MTSKRYVGLDALRGLAALCVVFFHGLSHNGLLWESGFGNSLGKSPFAFAISGGAAVMLFFVISGFVLGAASRSSDFTESTRRWIISRLVRLYLPIYPAILLAVVVNELVTQRVPYSSLASAIALDATLIFGHGNLLEVLWSLRWEIVFSICLPFTHVFGLHKVNARFGLVMSLVVSLLGNLANIGLLQYLPVLFAGFFLERLSCVCTPSRLAERAPRLKRNKLLGLSLGLFLLGMELNAILLADQTWFVAGQAAGQLASIIGSLLLVWLITQGRFVRFGTQTSLAFLGRISFSLYLVHKPVIEALQLPVPFLHIVISTLLAILLASLFYVGVEKPSLNLSRKIRAGTK